MLKKHKKIQAENIKDELSDEVVGLDLSKLEHFFTESAWVLVKDKGNSYKEWYVLQRALLLS